MAAITRISQSVALVVAGAVLATSSGSTGSTVSHPERPMSPAPLYEVVGADHEELRLAQWAKGRYDAAGLTLPNVVVAYHGNVGPCTGWSGLYRPGEPHEVHLCVDEGSPPSVHKLTLLHELGHAWAETQTGEATRKALLDNRDLDSWIDPELPRHLWGAEHAAEVVSWGLMDELMPIVRIYDVAPERLETAYRLLTGSDPLVPRDV